jgi:hypothetical protein
MKKLTKFSDYIVENAFYTTQLEKDVFIKDEKSVMNAFFLSFVGWVSLLSSAKSRGKVKTYFRSDKKLRLTTIDDSNNDTSLIIKIMADEGYFKTSKTPREITRFLVLARDGKIDDVNPIVIRDWLNEIKPDMILKADPKVRVVYDTFMAGGTLGQMAHDFRRIAKTGINQKFATIELVSLTQGLQIDKSNGSLAIATGAQPAAVPTPAAATVAQPAAVPTAPAAKSDAAKSAVWSVADIIPSDAPGTAVAPVAAKRRGRPPKNAVSAVVPPAPPAPVPVALKRYTDAASLYAEFKAGKTAANIEKEYKLNKSNINSFLVDLYTNGRASILDNTDPDIQDSVLETTKLFKNNIGDIDQTKLRSAIFKTKNSHWSDHKKSLSFAAKTGILNLYSETAPTWVSDVVREFTRRLAAYIKEQSDIRLGGSYENDIKAFKTDYLDTPVFSTYIKNKPLQLPNLPSYINDVVIEALMVLDDPLQGLSNRSIINIVNNKYFFSLIQLDLLTPALRDKLVSMGVKSVGNLEKIVGQLLKGTSYSGISAFSWDEADALKGVDLKELTTVLQNQPDKEFKDFIANMLRIKGTIHDNNKPLLDWIIDQYDVKSGNGTYYSYGSYATTYVRVKLAEKILDYITLNGINPVDANTVRTGGYNSTLVRDLHRTFLEANVLDGKIKTNLAKLAKANVINLVGIINRNRNAYAYAEFAEFETLKDNIIADIYSKSDQDEIDTVILKTALTDIRYLARKLLNDAPISRWSNMSASNKKLFDKLYAEMEIMGINPVSATHKTADAPFYTRLSDDDLTDKFTLTRASLPWLSAVTALSLEEKTVIFDRIISTDKGKEYFIANMNDLPQQSYMEIVLNSKKLENTLFARYIQTLMDNMGKYDWRPASSWAAMAEKEDDLSEKGAILLEKSLLNIDSPKSGVRKNSREYQNFMTNALPAFSKYVDQNEKAAEKLFLSTSIGMQRRLAAQYLGNKEFALSAAAAVTSSNQPIRPFKALSKKQINDILKYNNVVSVDTLIPAKHLKSFATMESYAKEAQKTVKVIEDLAITETGLTTKKLAELSVRMFQTKRAGKHGSNSMIIKRAFDAKVPIQITSMDKFLKEYPNSDIMIPMYHGTSDVAASMILRYGFRIIMSGNKVIKTAGKMLGNGIYSAPNYDKSLMYVGDNSSNRAGGVVGERGYIFSMKAALGPPINHRDKWNKENNTKGGWLAAGVGGDGIRSAEYCLFREHGQYAIVRVYEVEIIDKYAMERLVDSNPLTPGKAASLDQYISHNLNTLSEGNYTMGFKSFAALNENTQEDELEYTTYTFINGFIPISHSEFVDFEEFKPKNKNVTLEPSAYGPSIVVSGTRESNNYLFTGPSDFMVNQPEVFEEYLKNISE